MHRLVEDATAIEQAVHIWRDKMGADSSGQIALPSLGIWGSIESRPRNNRGTSKFHSRFRRQIAREPNVVLIDIPPSGINENVLGAISQDSAGQRWILRQGLLGRAVN